MPAGTLAGYQYRANGGQPVTVGNVNDAHIDGLPLGVDAAFDVRSFDDRGQLSRWSSPLAHCVPSDTYPSDVPTGVGGVAQSTSQILFSWNAAVDAVGYEYKIDGGSVIDNGNVLTALASGAWASATPHTIEVRSYDRASNRSAFSPPATVYTLAILTPGAVHDFAADDLALANGAGVATWVDRMAHGNFTQPNPANQQTFVTNATPQGKAAIRGSIASKFMQANSTQVIKHIFVIAAYTSVAAAANDILLLTHGSINEDGWGTAAGNIWSPNPPSVHRRNGVTTNAIYPNGVFALYERVQNTSRTDLLYMYLCAYANLFPGPFDVSRLMIYPTELTGADLTNTQLALMQQYL